MRCQVSEKQESVDEILAKALEETRGSDGVIYTMDGRTVLEYIDRIKAARKRESEEAERDHVAAVTNAATQAVNMTNERWERDTAKLRELVRELVNKLDDAWDFINRIGSNAEEVCDGLHEEMEKARAALKGGEE